MPRPVETGCRSIESVAVAQSAGTGPFGWPVADAECIASRRGDSLFTWGIDADLAAIETRPRLAVASDLVLRQLDPAALAPDAERITERLRALYDVITAGGASLTIIEESDA
jgi:hypothetical protein